MRRVTEGERQEFEQYFRLARPIKPKAAPRKAKTSGGAVQTAEMTLLRRPAVFTLAIVWDSPQVRGLTRQLCSNEGPSELGFGESAAMHGWKPFVSVVGRHRACQRFSMMRMQHSMFPSRVSAAFRPLRSESQTGNGWHCFPCMWCMYRLS